MSREQGLGLCEDCQVEERNSDCLCCDKEASITDKKFDGMSTALKLWVIFCKSFD